jgi:hypothetical protein
LSGVQKLVDYMKEELKELVAEDKVGHSERRVRPSLSSTLETRAVFPSERCRSAESVILATDLEVQVLFPGLPNFLRSTGSVTGYTQPFEYN